MADVFISYSKQDVTEARMLAALLEANGYTVWWDPNLMCGDRFREEIAKELSKASAVIAIWTKSLVASEWVQSEAGRAHRNQKLLPVRSSELEYDEIPPPFENVHTLRVNQTEQILAAVAGQLAKPAAAGPWWKVLRYKVLTWLGMIGGAITLTTNTSGFFKLSAAFSWVLHNWSGLLKYFWQALLLFKVEVPAAMLLFAWKAAVFPELATGLVGVAIAVITGHLLFSRITSWRSKGLLSVGAGIIAGAMVLHLGPPPRPLFLDRAKLSGQSLMGYDFRSASLREADLRDADLRRINLYSANLTGANLSRANLRNVILAEANLYDAVLSGANLNWR